LPATSAAVRMYINVPTSATRKGRSSPLQTAGGTDRYSYNRSVKMSITVNLYYTGTNGNARKFAEEMVSSGIVDAVRAE